MKLVIGGYAQGKLQYVLRQYDPAECFVWNGEELTVLVNGLLHEEKDTLILNHLHSWIRNCLLAGGNPEEEISTFLMKYPDVIIISDEVGNGIVPVDSFEREYRERTGRILVRLAGQAKEVERVICGIGQKIK